LACGVLDFVECAAGDVLYAVDQTLTSFIDVLTLESRGGQDESDCCSRCDSHCTHRERIIIIAFILL
jgi:hypothetical protein